SSECVFFFSSRRRHTRLVSDWSSDVCSSDLRRGFPERTDRGRDSYGAKQKRRERVRQRNAVAASVIRQAFRDDTGNHARRQQERSEERRVGKEWRSRWSRWY